MRCLLGKHRDRLDSRGACLNDPDAIAAEVHALMRPMAGVVGLALKGCRSPRIRACWPTRWAESALSPGSMVLRAQRRIQSADAERSNDYDRIRKDLKINLAQYSRGNY